MPTKPRSPLIIIPVILMMVILPTSAFAEYEDIEPETVGSPDQWQTFGGPNKIILVTDTDDFTYIYEDSAGHVQVFALTDPSGISGNDTIDSVNVIWRAQDNGNGTNEGRVILYLSGNTETGPAVGLTASWINYDHSFPDRPGGSGWAVDDVNDLEIQTECVSVAKSRQVRCSRIYVRIYFTPAPANVSSRRKTIRLESGG